MTLNPTGQKLGSVIWVTGLSSAGKTTLCQAYYKKVKPTIPHLVLLDGDAVREAFGHDLTHKETDRIRQVRRLQGMSNVLARQGLDVIVGVLYNNPDLLAWNRETLPNYFEVYLKASLGCVAERDNKGLYSASRDGTMKDVVGIDIPWYEPEKADLVIDIDKGDSPETNLQVLLDALAVRNQSA